MQMFAYRKTEESIRQIQAMKTEQANLAGFAKELEEMRRQIAQMQARIDGVVKPVIVETMPVYRSTFQRLEQRTCRLFKLSRADLYAQCHQRRFSLARQFLMYWACRRTTLSLPQIGRLMHRDHTTILHGKQAYVAKRAKMGRTLRSVR
jgi:chromosomal replication initiation ATPase DnaA